MLGLSNAEIAAELEISVQTVNTYSGTVVRKMGARNRMHAVVLLLVASVFPDLLETGIEQRGVQAVEQETTPGEKSNLGRTPKDEIGRATGVTEPLEVAASQDGGRRRNSGGSA